MTRLSDADLGIAPAQPQAQTKRLSDADLGIASAPSAAPQQSFFQGLTGQLAQGATLGFSDEVSGAAAGVSDWLKGKTFSGGYNRGVEEERARLAQFQQQHPILSTTTRILGGVGGGMPAAAPAPAAAAPGLLKQMGKGALIGGGYGAVSGFGSSEGGLANRATGATMGAATGAAVGGAVPLAVSGVGKVVDTLRGQRPTEVVGRRILKALVDDGVSPDDAMARYQEWLQDGAKPEALFELGGQNTRDLLNSSVNVPGPMREKGRQFLESRQEATGGRILSDAQAGISKQSYGSTVDDLIQQRKTAAKPLYDAAYEKGGAGVWSDTLDDLVQRPTMAKAWKEAAASAADEGDRLPQIFKTDDAGNIVDVETIPNLKVWDYIKRGLDDVVLKNQDAVTGKLTPEGLRAVRMKEALLAELDDLVPEYAQARASFAGPSQSLDAVKLGRDFFKGRLEDMRAQVARLPASEREFFKVGVMEAIRERVGNKGDMANIAQALRGTPNLRERLMLAFDDGAEADKFMRLLARERDMTANYGAAIRGSPTSPRERISADMLADIGVDMATGGSPLGAVRKVAQAFVGGQASRLDQATGNRLAELLLSTDPQRNIALLDALRGQYANQNAGSAHRQLANALLTRVGGIEAGRKAAITGPR